MRKSHNSPQKDPSCEPSAAEKEHRAEERRVWGRQIRIASWLNYITAGGVIAAAAGLIFIYLGLKESKRASNIAHDALVASNRAWLGPIDAILNGPIQTGQQIKVLIVFENTGKEPALDVSNIAGGGITMPFSAAEAAQQQRTGPFGGVPFNACAQVAPQDGYPAIFPTATRHMQADIQQTFIADEAILNGSRTFFVHGCAAYRTMGEIHTSEYCFWLGPRVDPKNGLRIFQPCLGSFRAN
jgi:hypothetical protein